ncbi:MAG: hypothetical protein ACD_3C00106G0010 [uncultured bacterium (gcode 4)]|uniref:Phenylalanine--tRNA ligase beta subunit n=1 Tax=uncultured bacterium (gcode 4) TaxID=1234023 RepID=K2FA90_9BACT|nr:MAG: hypothetical protein ACD_3C00106G0010 [uncultured bacterium (gcode 4)]
MKIPLNWISLYSDISTLLQNKWITDLAHLYSIHTAEIDAIERFWQEKKVVIWKVIEAGPHPDSDHLNIVQVDLWALWATQIVCWANNVIWAKYVPVATVGSVLKWDFEIKSARLRWQESNWMICSEDELDLQDTRAPWIMRLEEYFNPKILEDNIWKSFFDLKINILGFNGLPYESALKDIVFEIDNKFITNRPDLFSVEWNAREFSAIFDLPFANYENQYVFSDNKLNVNILTDKVLSYHLVKVNDVQSAESPFSIKYTLYKSWINPKFDLVDMTNYVMTELGQPMHAFDADKIVGSITVRPAKSGETLLALNWETYKLDERDTVIADDVKVLAIWWIIWGQDSAISDTTKDIYIESACFEASSIRLSAQRLWVRTDSSTRYEKSLDPLLTYKALSRALDFLKFVWKNWDISGDFEYLNKSALKNVELILDPEFVRTKIGVFIPNAEIERILKALWFEFLHKDSKYIVTVPSWRVTKDISIKEDLAEEIWRVYWYDKVPETPMIWEQIVYGDNKSLTLRQNTQNYFAWKGWLEVYNYSFSNESLDEKIGITDNKNAIRILNAYSNEFTILRRKMIANLLVNVADNKKIWDSFSFFEISKIEWKEESGFKEMPKIAWISYSTAFAAFQSDMIWFINSMIPNIAYSIKQWTSLDSYPYLHPNKSGELILSNGDVLWYFWYINPQVATNFDLDDSKVLYFELDFKSLLDLSQQTDHVFKDLPKYPWIDREINFVMNENTATWEVVWIIKNVNPLIKNVRVVDTYRSEEKLWINKKSVTFAAYLLDYEKTITDDEALSIQNSIIKELSKIWIELRK